MNLVGHNCMPEHVVSIQVSICLGLKIKEKSLNLKFKPNQTYISFKHYNYPVRYYWSIVATTVTLGVSQSPPPFKRNLDSRFGRRTFHFRNPGGENEQSHIPSLSMAFYHNLSFIGVNKVDL
jgi:hypothetical protein